MAHKRKRRRQGMLDGELSMTPMIDIVFQLLIYFILTFEPQDVMAHLDVYRPAPDPDRVEQPPTPNLLRVVIYPNGFAVNDNPMALPQIENLLGRLAAIDTRQTVLIMADPRSRHDDLVQILDICAKVGLRNLSVISMN